HSTGAAADRPHLPPRMASGDITGVRAVIWGQIDSVAEMEVEYSQHSLFTDSSRVRGPVVDELLDFSGQVELQNLAPATVFLSDCVPGTCRATGGRA
ncbi:MAG: PhoD-like phosphatase N-terminal domain-containing protein, partial [Nitrospira sp.]|nr:PhoD-like phosphatase N-terminal domain-containing protein [Nitrospira sp.]